MKKKDRRKAITFHVSEEEHQQILILKEKALINIASLIRILIKNYCDAHPHFFKTQESEGK